jgi:hypothetical protein
MKFRSVCVMAIAIGGFGTSTTAQERVSVTNDPVYPVRLAMAPASGPDGSGQHTLTLHFENTSDKPVVAFAVGYRHVGEQETAKPRRALTFFAAAKDRMIQPGATRQLTQKGSSSPGPPVVGRIDLIVFADGSAVGPNRLEETRLVQARLLAQRTVLKELLTRIQNLAPNAVIQKMVQDELDAFPSVVKQPQPGGEAVAMVGR